MRWGCAREGDVLKPLFHERQANRQQTDGRTDREIESALRPDDDHAVND